MLAHNNTFGSLSEWLPDVALTSGRSLPRVRTSGGSWSSSSTGSSRSKLYYATPDQMASPSHSPDADETPRVRDVGLPMIDNRTATIIQSTGHEAIVQDQVAIATAARLLRNPGDEYDDHRTAAAAAFVSGVVDVTGRLEKLGRFPVAGGGNSDIWKGILQELERGVVSTRRPVAIKVLRGVRIRGGEEASARLLVRLQREVRIWEQLRHDHIVPLLGFAFEEQYPCMVAPWYESGTVINYVERNPEADKSQLVLQVLDGLIYLHSYNPPIVHGDLKGANILIDDRGCAQISDFGLSRILQDGPSGYTTSSVMQGSVRWMAPELFLQDKRTAASDIYAFGLLALEVFSGGVPPFRHLADLVFLQAISQGAKPERAHYAPLVLEEHIWLVFESTWCIEPHERPAAVTVKTLYTDALAGRYNTQLPQQLQPFQHLQQEVQYHQQFQRQFPPQQGPYSNYQHPQSPVYTNDPYQQQMLPYRDQQQAYQRQPPNPVSGQFTEDVMEDIGFQHLNVNHPLYHALRQQQQSTGPSRSSRSNNVQQPSNGGNPYSPQSSYRYQWGHSRPVQGSNTWPPH